MASLEEELVAVEAIFPECLSRGLQSSRRLTIHPFSDSGSNAVSITLSIPEDYPTSPPVIIGFVGINPSLVRELLKASWTPGEVHINPPQSARPLMMMTATMEIETTNSRCLLRSWIASLLLSADQLRCIQEQRHELLYCG